METREELTDPESVKESRPFLLGRVGMLTDFGVIVDVVSCELLFRISMGLGIWSPGK